MNHVRSFLIHRPHSTNELITHSIHHHRCIPQVKIPRSASVNSQKCKPLFQNPQNEITDFRKVKIPNSATENSCFPQKNWGLFFYISSFLISRYAHDLDSPVISTMYLTISFFFSFSLTFVRIISRARFF